MGTEIYFYATINEHELNAHSPVSSTIGLKENEGCAVVILNIMTILSSSPHFIGGPPINTFKYKTNESNFIYKAATCESCHRLIMVSLLILSLQQVQLSHRRLN